MRTRIICAPSNQLERVQSHFELWRKTRKRGSRIPETLWAAAVEVACEQGVHRIARALRLDYYSLKERLPAIAGQPRRSPNKATFVELLPAEANRFSVCTIEMENAQGGKIKMHLPGLGSSDLEALSNSFWKVGL